jgi:hypothetical protein
MDRCGPGCISRYRRGSERTTLDGACRGAPHQCGRRRCRRDRGGAVPVRALATCAVMLGWLRIVACRAGVANCGYAETRGWDSTTHGSARHLVHRPSRQAGLECFV